MKPVDRPCKFICDWKTCPQFSHDGAKEPVSIVGTDITRLCITPVGPMPYTPFSGAAVGAKTQTNGSLSELHIPTQEWIARVKIFQYHEFISHNSKPVSP